ncbi:DUF3179 domain-containing protein [bacterium]|nr:DUF3179 domain-containing protein [bacterium]
MKRIFHIVLCLVVLSHALSFSISIGAMKRLGFSKTNFEKTSISFHEIMSGGPGKDGIPSIDSPKFISVQTSILNKFKQEPLIVIDYKNEVKAYPLRLLIWHEITNDLIDGESIAITFCPLCNAAIVFDTHFNGKNHRFGVSGLLRNSDMIFYDDETQTLWQQFTGLALIGDHMGRKLNQIASLMMSFDSFSKKYPKGLVLSSKTGFNRQYGKNPYAEYDEGEPYFPTFPINSRKRKLGRLLGFFINDQAYHFTLKDFRKYKDQMVDGYQLKVVSNGKHNAALNKSSIGSSKLVPSVSVYLVDELTNEKKLLVSSIFFRFAWLGFYPNSTEL